MRFIGDLYWLVLKCWGESLKIVCKRREIGVWGWLIFLGSLLLREREKWDSSWMGRWGKRGICLFFF